MPTPFLTLETMEGMTVAKKEHPQVVVVIPFTKDGKIVLAKQYRPAVKSDVIGLPAGHIGDDPGYEKESSIEAAQRELLEEVGYGGGVFTYLGFAASTPGMTDEITHFVLARKLKKVQEADSGDENITVYTMGYHEIYQYLEETKDVISAQMLAALWMYRKFIVRKITKNFTIQL